MPSKSSSSVDAHRVAIILPKLEVNGVNKVHFELAAEFLRRRIAVDILTRTPARALTRQLPSGVWIEGIGTNGPTRFFPDLVRYLHRRRPSHVISVYDDVSMMVMTARALTRQRFFLLVAVHNSVLGSHTIHSPKRRLTNWLTEQFVRYGYEHVDAVVAVSDGLVTELCEQFGVERQQIRVIHNPVIANDFAALRDAPLPIEWPFESTDRVVGFFGRLEPQKDVSTLLNAFACMNAAQRARLLIVGEGCQHDALVTLARELRIAQYTRFVPFMSNPFPLIRRCDLVALPSRYEGYPNVLVEAMACGCQVVATDCRYGPREILQDGRLGQLVPVRDSAALATAIGRSLSGAFSVPKERLMEAGLAHTATRSADAYLRLMRIDA